jgi:hypothetical protein
VWTLAFALDQRKIHSFNSRLAPYFSSGETAKMP